MTQLLNRFAWFISIAFGCSIAFWLWGASELMLIVWLLFAIIIKSLFLSHDYIASRLQHFKKALKQNKSETTITQIHDEAELNEPENLQQTNTSYIPDESKNIALIAEDSSSEFREKVSEKTNYKNSSFSTQNKIKTEEENFVTNFFSENILAKIWWILVFLGVIFLLTLVWTAIPWVLKIVVWFAIAFWTYLVWVKLDKKWLIHEWRILLWLAVLINYAVILSGRYLIWDTSLDTTPIFSAWLSFFFLILNTVFAVLTALYYKSTPLLIFSFAFAYLNPFLIGIQETTPYIQVWYSIILSLWALYLSVKEKNTSLLVLAFTLWNLLIFSAANSTGNLEIWYVVQFISLIWITLLWLLSGIKMEEKAKQFIEFLFAWSFFVVWFFGLLFSPNELSIVSFLLSIGASFLFIIVSYYHMHKWPFLYSIWSVWWALVLSSSLIWDKTDFIIYSMISVILYFTLNIYGALKLKIDNNNTLKNVVIWSVFWILFIGFEIFKYATINEQPLILLWILYMLLALIYFWTAYYIANKIWLKNIKEDVFKQNLLYNFVWISISLISLAIALIFSEYYYVIPLFWLFESTILLYFFKKIWDFKIFIAALILIALWIYGLIYSSFLFSITGNYFYLVTFGLICISMVLNIIFTKESKPTLLRNIHDILQVLALLIVTILVSSVFDNQYYLLISWFFMSWAGYIYKKYGSNILQSAFILMISLWFILHVINVLEVLMRVDFNHTIHYITSLILVWATFVFIKTPDRLIRRSQLIAITALYLFAITTMYIYQIFPNVFAITLYWWALAFILISRWIWKDIIALRTTGLYLIMLMCLKIFFIDIPYSINETIIKVVAFIAVWIMLIIISSMYSKKYGNQLKWEYQLSNLFGKKSYQETQNVRKKDPKATPHGEAVKANTKSVIDINQKIADIDIDNIDCVTFAPIDGKKFRTKSRNLLKIVVMIMWEETTKSFEANELLTSYKYIMKNYKSDLNQRDLERIKTVVFDFVKKWGTVTVKK